MHEEGLPLLKRLATSDDIKLKRAVCNAFANLCSDGSIFPPFSCLYQNTNFLIEENVEIVLGDGGLEMIVSFLNTGDDELIAGALHTLANVASAGKCV